MSAVRMPNNLEGDGPIIPPIHDDGRPYAFCMYFNSDVEAAFADTMTDLIDVLIPGYLDLDGAEQDFQRIRLAQTVAARTQAEILATLEPGDVTDEEMAVLAAPRGISQPRADWWTCQVPLVVVETGYEPFTAIPRPASGLADGLAVADNLWFIRPAEEEDFLISLHEVGYLRLMANSDSGEL